MSDTNGHKVGCEAPMNFTPHSMRAFLVSGASVLGGPRESLKWLQGWNMQGREGYVRTCCTQTMLVQETVAHAAREPENGEDPFREGADLKALEEFLLKRNVEPLEAQRIKEALATFPMGGERLLTWEQREPSLLSSKRVREDAEPVSVVAAGHKESSLTDDVKNSSVQTGVEVLEPRVAGHLASERTDGEVATPKGYVTSISGKRRLRRLHYVGQCHRLPGVDYLEFETHGEKQPHATLYDDYCRQCWRSGPPQTGEDSVATESESSSSSASSSVSSCALASSYL